MKNKKTFSFKSLFIIITIIIFIIFFDYAVKNGLIKTDSSHDDSQRIGLVNDVPVTGAEYKLLIKFFYKKIKFSKNDTLNKTDSSNAKDSAWEKLIKKSILDQNVIKSGITITEEKINFTDPYNKFVVDYFNDVLEPSSETSLNEFAGKRFKYYKLFNEVTKNITDNNDKAAEFSKWYNDLRSKAEIHDLRDRFFREN